MPGKGGESGAIWVGLSSSVIGGRGGAGGGGGGGSGGCGGAVSTGGFSGPIGWPTDPFSLSMCICTGGRDETLGHTSSSRTPNTSVAGCTLGGSSRRLISVGGGGGGNASTSSSPEFSLDGPLLDESSAGTRNKHKKIGKCWTLNI